MKIANSITKTAELKTIAVTKVSVDAVFADAALTPDLQNKSVGEKNNEERKDNVHGGWQGRRKD